MAKQCTVLHMTVDAKPNNSVQYNSKNSMKNKLLISLIFFIQGNKKRPDKYMKQITYTNITLMTDQKKN